MAAIRGFRLAAFAAATMAVLIAPALAQSNYPNRPIRMLVGFPPGGAADIVARVVGNALSARLGQPVVIENKAGTGGNMAAAEVARAEPNCYTLLHGPDNIFLVNPHLYGTKMPIDPLKDLVPVASLTSNQLILAVHPSVKANTLQEFVELARASKPPLFYASIGNGSMHHMAMEIFKQQLKLDLQHVPYRGGGPAGAALLAGEIQAMFGAGSLVPTITSGKVRALGSTGGKRSPVLPELPTIGEIYPGYEVLIWHGTFAPAGTPAPILERLRTELKAVLEQPDVRDRLVQSGSGEPYMTSPEEFAKRIRADNEMFGKIIRSIGLKVE